MRFWSATLSPSSQRTAGEMERCCSPSPVSFGQLRRGERWEKRKARKENDICSPLNLWCPHARWTLAEGGGCGGTALQSPLAGPRESRGVGALSCAAYSLTRWGWGVHAAIAAKASLAEAVPPCSALMSPQLRTNPLFSALALPLALITPPSTHPLRAFVQFC